MKAGICFVLAVVNAALLLSVPLQEPARIEVNVIQIPLLVTVTDNKGQHITNLKKENFRVFEDGKAQRIDSFALQADRPLSIALLIDTSSSAYTQLEFERAAATDFFAKVLKPRKDRAAIIGFDNEVTLAADFTDDQGKLSEGLKKLQAIGSTSVFDAVYIASQKTLAAEAGDRRRVIILISDGYDTASDKSLKQAAEMAQRHDVVIYAISISQVEGAKMKGDERSEGEKAIKHLVTETGGKSYYPKKLTELGLEFQKIEQELRSQYLLSYAPTGAFNGAYRKLRIDMTDRKYKAHTRAGYYASK